MPGEDERSKSSGDLGQEKLGEGQEEQPMR